MLNFSDHILYYKPTCPYCKKVMNYLSMKEINLEMRNTEDPAIREELIAIGGKAQVPCLCILTEAIYESSDIIDYFRKSAG